MNILLCNFYATLYYSICNCIYVHTDWMILTSLVILLTNSWLQVVLFTLWSANYLTERVCLRQLWMVVSVYLWRPWHHLRSTVTQGPNDQFIKHKCNRYDCVSDIPPRSTLLPATTGCLWSSSCWHTGPTYIPRIRGWYFCSQNTIYSRRQLAWSAVDALTH